MVNPSFGTCVCVLGRGCGGWVGLGGGGMCC